MMSARGVSRDLRNRWSALMECLATSTSRVMRTHAVHNTARQFNSGALSETSARISSAQLSSGHDREEQETGGDAKISEDQHLS